MVVQDEDTLLKKLLSFSDKQAGHKKTAQEKTLNDMVSRIRFVEDASKRLFEEKIAGNVPDSLFRKMMAVYVNVLTALKEDSTELAQDSRLETANETDVLKWMELAKDCLSIDRLDRPTAYQRIDHVAIHEQADEYELTCQNIKIKYNFAVYLR